MSKSKQHDKLEQDEAGRVSHPEQGKESNKKEDISCVDRQEGEMNNGELGGNFNETLGHSPAGNNRSAS